MLYGVTNSRTKFDECVDKKVLHEFSLVLIKFECFS